MSYCPGCGTALEDDWSHCPQCGDGHPSDSAKSPSQRPAFPISRTVSLGSLVLIAVGAFLPWVSVSVLGARDSVAGIGTLGIGTLAISVILGVLVLVTWSSGMQILTLFAGLGIAGVAALCIVDPLLLVEKQVAAVDDGLIHPDIGLYATLLGGVAMAVASVYAPSDGGGASDAPATGDEVGDEEDHSEPVGYERGLDDRAADRKDAGDAILSLLEDTQIATQREFQRQVYPDSRSGYDSKDEWWEGFARPFLEDHDAVKQLDGTARRWSLRDPGFVSDDE